MRGHLSDKIQEVSRERLGREITQVELRLIPYLSYCLQNERRIEARKVNEDELRTLREWEAEGLIRMTPFKVSCTRAFWELMQEVVWLGYVTYDEAEEH